MAGDHPSDNDIREAVAAVKHPAINCSLVELGIVRSLAVSGDTVRVTMAFPFPEVPIKQLLIDSVTQPIQRLGLRAEVRSTVMDESERQRFLALEKQNWKGGV
jgi:metal-sulfur cluster biosynthetic enzyme